MVMAEQGSIIHDIMGYMVNADAASESALARQAGVIAPPIYETPSILPIDEVLLGKRVIALNKAMEAYFNTVGVVFHAATQTAELTKAEGYDRLNDAAKREVSALLEKREEMLAQVRLATTLVKGPLKEVAGHIKEAYQVADGLAEASGSSNPVDRAAMRVIMMGGRMLPTTDLDGTLTQGDEHIKRMPTQVLEKLLQSLGREGFLEASLPTVHRIRDIVTTMRTIGAQYVSMRLGVGHFITYAKEHLDARPIIITANYMPFIQGALANTPEANGNVRVFGVTRQSTLSIHKDIILQYLARTNPNRAVFYCADGLTDESAIAAADDVAFFFTLKDGGFERLCQEHHLLYFPYETFDDVTGYLQQIQNRIPALRSSISQRHTTVA